MSNKSKIKFNNSYLRKFNDEYLNSFNNVSIQIAEAGEGPTPSSYNITYSLSGATISPQPTTIAADEVITLTVSYSYSYSNYFNVTNATYTSLGNGIYEISNPTGSVTISASSSSECLLEGTKVLLANGETKNIEDIKYDDLLLSYDVFLGKFVPQYPVVIIEGRDDCIEYSFNVYTESGRVLKIGSAHEVYNLLINRFVALNYKDVDNGLIDINNFALARYENGEFVADKMTRIERVHYSADKKAYAVYLPMLGSLITDDFLTSGNFMSSEIGENFMKEQKSTLNIGNNIKNAVLNFDHTLDIDTEYEKMKELIHPQYPARIYYCSSNRYVKHIANQFGIPLDKIHEDENYLVISRYLLDAWVSECLKPFPAICNIKIGTNIYQCEEFGTFMLPINLGYDKYLDLSTYRIYYPGEEMKVYCSTNVLGLKKNDQI